MGLASSYQPFLIGRFQTGKFDYFQPWQSPEDAFNPLENAYVYRGTLNKRQGYQETGLTGLLRYTNIERTDSDNPAGVSYNIQTTKFPVVAGSVFITTLVGGTKTTIQDDSNGAFTGAYDNGSTIDYTTGAIVYNVTGAPDNNVPITVTYTFTNSLYAEPIDSGDGATLTFSGVLTSFPIVSLSLSIVTTTLAGATEILDDGLGNLSGAFLAGGSFINYTTGAWNLIFTSAPQNVANNIVATYVPTSAGNPIMGINHWENETTGAFRMTVEDTRRMCTFNTTTKLFDPVNTFSQDVYIETAGGTSFGITLPWTNIAPYSVSVTATGNGVSETIVDVPNSPWDGSGKFTSSGNLSASSTINYDTGALTINYSAYAVAKRPITFTVAATLTGDYFNGGNENFFKYTNWKANDSDNAYLYLTNNTNRITLYEGVSNTLSRPSFITDEENINNKTNGIATCLDVKVYKDRLLLLRPTVVETAGSFFEGQVIYYSSRNYMYGIDFIPFDFIPIRGHGGFVRAPTADLIVAGEFLRDAIVVFLQRSTWLFRATGAANDPFRFDQINTSKNANAPYGSLTYDDYATAMGNKGLYQCDGVSVQRYDNAVIDQHLDIDNDNFTQANAIRDDVNNQSWMIYPSVRRDTGNNFSDTALIYNFLENSFSTYDLDLSTLGNENTFQDVTWSSFAVGSGIWTEGLTWAEANFSWSKFATQNLAPVIYGGSQYGYVYMMNVGETDNGAHIDSTMTSKRWNPFVQTGQGMRCGYIDIYYRKDPDCYLKIELFANNSGSSHRIEYMQLTAPESEDYHWQRLYVNLEGEFIRMRISTPILPPNTLSINGNPNDEILNNGTYQISGIIVWAAPSGRLTPGGLLS